MKGLFAVLAFVVRRLFWVVLLALISHPLHLPPLLRHPDGLAQHLAPPGRGSTPTLRAVRPPRRPVKVEGAIRASSTSCGTATSAARSLRAPVTQIIRQRAVPVTSLSDRRRDHVVPARFSDRNLVGAPTPLPAGQRPDDPGRRLRAPSLSAFVFSYLLGFKLHVFRSPRLLLRLLRSTSTFCGSPNANRHYHLLLPWLTFALLFTRPSTPDDSDVTCSRRWTRLQCATSSRAKRGPALPRCCARHVVGNAMLPVVSMLSMDIGVAFGGSALHRDCLRAPRPGQGALCALQRATTCRGDGLRGAVVGQASRSRSADGIADTTLLRRSPGACDRR